MICTVNDVRVRLYHILKELFIPEVSQKYNNFETEVPEQVMFDNADQTDELVVEVSKHLQNKEYCQKLLLSVSDEVFFTLFMRYHLFTCYLKLRSQDSIANVPDKNSDFFEKTFTAGWKLALLGN